MQIVSVTTSEMDKLTEKYIKDHRRQFTKVELTGTKLFLEVDELSKERVQSRFCALDNVIHHDRVERKCARSVAQHNGDLEIKVIKSAGSMLSQFGYENKKGKFLYPEEALYLMETNRLELVDNDLKSWSLREAYEIFLDQHDLKLKNYRVYKSLVSNGYRVIRRSEFDRINQHDNTRLISVENHSKNVCILSTIGQLDEGKKRKSIENNDLLLTKRARLDPLAKESPKTPVCLALGQDCEDTSSLTDNHNKKDCIANDMRTFVSRIKMFAPKNSNTQTSECPNLDYYYVYLPNSSTKSKPSYKLFISENRQQWSEDASEDVPCIYAECSSDNIAFYTLCQMEIPDLF